MLFCTSLITAIMYFSPSSAKFLRRKQDKMADIKGCQSQIETLRYNCISLMSTRGHVRILLPMNCRSQITAKKFKEASKTLIQIKVLGHLQTPTSHTHTATTYTRGRLQETGCQCNLAMCTSTPCRFVNAYNALYIFIA